MKLYIVHLVSIVWHTSLVLKCGSAQASKCDISELSCEISDDSYQESSPESGDGANRVCVNESDDRGVNIEVGRTLTFTCLWTHNIIDSTFKWNLNAPEGWKVLLRVDSTRAIKVKAGDRYPTDRGDSTEGNTDRCEEDSRYFDSVEDRYFYGADHFLSRTNMIRIKALIHQDRGVLADQTDYDETFQVITRTVQVIDYVDSQSEMCDISHMHEWNENGYNGLNSALKMFNGSLSIQCNKRLLQTENVISFCYNITADINQGMFTETTSGFIQHLYVDSRDLIIMIIGYERNLYITCNFSQCDSFWLRFDASGKMDLNIYNITVQGLIYDKSEVEPNCMPETSSPPTQLPSSPSPRSTSPVPYASTAEGETSATNIQTMTTHVFNSVNERQGAEGSQGFLIPTVSVVAIVTLVAVAVFSICCKTRYYKKQSRDRDSTALEGPVSLDNERHDYYEVLPSVKRPSGKTVNGANKPSLPVKDNNSTSTGPMSVLTYEGTVDSDGKIDEVETLSAENTVFMNGQEYAMVDMEKMAFERKERTETARKKGQYLGSNNDNAYATLEPVKAFAEEDGQTKPNDLNLSSFQRVLMNGNEYAVVDVEKRALERRERAEIACNNGQYLESNDNKAGTLEPDKASEDGQTKLKNSNPSSFKGAPRFSSVKKNLHDTTSDDYDEVQLSDKGAIYKAPEGTTDYDEPEPFRSKTTEPYDELQRKINPNISSDFSKKSDHQTQGNIIDDSSHAYQTVSAPSSPIDSMQPGSYPLSDYETVSPPFSPGVISIGHGQYPSMNNETAGSPIAAPEEQVQCSLDTYDRVKHEGPPGKRDSNASHTYEDPVAMALALERPYDKLQRASHHREQTSTPKILATSDRGVTEWADPEGELNIYQEIDTPDVVLKESDESSTAYHNLERPHSKHSKADAPLPEIPGNEGYGKLDLDDTGTSYQTHAAPHLDRVTSGPTTKEAAPVYAILDNSAEANLPDDDDPDYDLLDAFV